MHKLSRIAAAAAAAAAAAGATAVAAVRSLSHQDHHQHLHLHHRQPCHQDGWDRTQSTTTTTVATAAKAVTPSLFPPHRCPKEQQQQQQQQQPIIMRTNTNFRGVVITHNFVENLRKLNLFRQKPPKMAVFPCEIANVDGTCNTTASSVKHFMKVIVFSNGKCRLMRCKSPNQFSFGQIVSLKCHLPVNGEDSGLELKVKIHSHMSSSYSYRFPHGINLFKLAKNLHEKGIKVLYEPELFQAARIIHYNPLCVNIFSSGACVILGVKKPGRVGRVIKELRRLINISGSKLCESLPSDTTSPTTVSTTGEQEDPSNSYSNSYSNNNNTSCITLQFDPSREGVERNVAEDVAVDNVVAPEGAEHMHLY